MAKLITFEDYLKEFHAKYYTGTDDDMPDSFERWLGEQDGNDLIRMAEELVAKLQS